MKLSFRWLGRHVDLSGVTPQELVRRLSLHVAEVDGLEPFAPHLAQVTVGHVLERAPHPDADKLGVCRVDLGAGEPLQIVCGAANVAAGQRVAVATVGTTLPGDFKIKRAKIRGVESVGMICSLRELALGDSHEGIWVLPGEPAVGAPVAEALELDDWVLEIDNKSITHRADLWGHRGLAREVAALFGRELRPLDTSLPPTGPGRSLPVRIDTAGCSRYLALALEGVRVEPSPFWLQALLLAVGQRPIDLLVDVSNFVMLDLGQPNHLFDRRRLGASIEVRNARSGETLTTLDGAVRELLPDDLLICSEDRAVGLAGVMGGEASAVAPDTSELVLEVANFHGPSVRRTAARLGARTDASARFEKSLDPTLVPAAAGHLVRTLAAIQPSLRLPARPTDEGTWTDPTRSIELAGEQVRRLLGVDLDDGAIAAALERLDFGVSRAGGKFTVRVPSFRAVKDITTPEDLIEEVGRTVGYAAIPGAKLMAEVAPPPRDARRELVRQLQDRLAGAAAFHEAPGYSFVPDPLLRATRTEALPHVQVVNPLTEGESRVRRSVVPSLLARLAPNLRQRSEVRLFEIGKGYLPECADAHGAPGEVHELGLCLAAPRPAEGARFDAGAAARLRGVLLDLLGAVGVHEPAVAGAGGELPGWAHPARAVRFTAAAPGGEPQDLGLLATLDPRVARELEVDADTAVAALSLDALLRCERRVRPYRPVPRFQGLKLDVAFAAPEATPAGSLLALIEAAGKGLLQSVELFDVYRGPNLPPGSKSLAFHLLLQSADRTLEEADQRKFLERLDRAAAAQGLELRRE
jgi:phenylalanyl-tRNA synthetase beta chain